MDMETLHSQGAAVILLSSRADAVAATEGGYAAHAGAQAPVADQGTSSVRQGSLLMPLLRGTPCFVHTVQFVPSTRLEVLYVRLLSDPPPAARSPPQSAFAPGAPGGGGASTTAPSTRSPQPRRIADMVVLSHGGGTGSEEGDEKVRAVGTAGIRALGCVCVCMSVVALTATSLRTRWNSRWGVLDRIWKLFAECERR